MTADRRHPLTAQQAAYVAARAAGRLPADAAREARYSHPGRSARRLERHRVVQRALALVLDAMIAEHQGELVEVLADLDALDDPALAAELAAELNETPGRTAPPLTAEEWSAGWRDVRDALTATLGQLVARRRALPDPADLPEPSE